MKLKSVIALIIALGIGYGAIEQVSNTIQPAAAQASVNNPNKWYKGTPTKLRHSWSNYNKTYGIKTTYVFFKSSFVLRGMDGGKLTNAKYEKLDKHTYTIKGYSKMYHAYTDFYVHYYSKHKIRIGRDIQSYYGNWPKFTR